MDKFSVTMYYCQQMGEIMHEKDTLVRLHPQIYDGGIMFSVMFVIHEVGCETLN
jgi:hypothetical protein